MFRAGHLITVAPSPSRGRREGGDGLKIRERGGGGGARVAEKASANAGGQHHHHHQQQRFVESHGPADSVVVSQILGLDLRKITLVNKLRFHHLVRLEQLVTCHLLSDVLTPRLLK